MGVDGLLVGPLLLRVGEAPVEVAYESSAGDGEGQDEFTFTLTKEEFLDLFFDDLGDVDRVLAALLVG